MKHFFDLTFRPSIAPTGAATLLGVFIAIWPRWSAESVLKINFIQEYTIILQHRGAVLGLVGVCMNAAAFWEKYRVPILIFSACEKAAMVYLVVVYKRYLFSTSFWLGSLMGAAVVLYVVSYFAVSDLRALYITGSTAALSGTAENAPTRSHAALGK